MFVVIANTLFSDNEDIKSLLIYLSPLVAVLLSTIWLCLKIKISHWARNKKIDGLLKKSEEILKSTIENGYASDKHVAELKTEVEKLRLQRVRLYIETSVKLTSEFE